MIKILSDDTIQKIAAGEVVEKPASIVKELVENSIDAGADQITVEIKSGGKTYIRVTDNGNGIESPYVELAFVRHATSKIDNFEDLYSIHSMGFRGEALASIASVSHVIMKTKSENEEVGTHIEYDNNKLIQKKSIAMNTGTSIEVLDLFKYIPARLKFLASDISESNKITQLMYVFAIGNPSISFTYLKDNREIFNSNNTKNRLDNNSVLFGKEFADNYIDIQYETDNYKVIGSLSNNKYYKGNRSMQFIYVNGRYIENSELISAIERAYHNYIPNGRYPLYEINIEVDPDKIDINIHPNKQKIKFSFEDELLTSLNENVSKALYEANHPKLVENKIEEDKYTSFYEINADDSYQRVLDAYKAPVDFNQVNKKDKPDIFMEDSNFDDYANNADDNKNTDFIIENNLDLEDNIKFTNDLKEDTQQLSFDESSFEYKTILFSTYIVYEDEKNSLIRLVDIKRARERILYDLNKEKNQNISQDLLSPIIVELSPTEIENYELNRDLFEELGYEIDLFDSNSLAIRQVPYYFDSPSDSKFFTEILDGIDKNAIDTKNKILRSSIAIASKLSSHINEDQAQSLYNELLDRENPHTNESGKTIIYEINKDSFIKFIDR